MKNMLFTAAVFTCLLGLSFSALARNGDPVPKGYLVVRDGATTTNANYANQDTDSNDRLQRVSALCADLSDTAGNVAALIATDGTHAWGAAHGVSRASTVINLGGNVVIDAQTNNPNHCLISGLKLSQIKGIWH
jgi:hypothetical protein